jgi:hypothetical protein
MTRRPDLDLRPGIAPAGLLAAWRGHPAEGNVTVAQCAQSALLIACSDIVVRDNPQALYVLFQPPDPPRFPDHMSPVSVSWVTL